LEFNSKNEVVSNILTSDIPPDEWQREIERVSSKLKMDYSVSNYSNSEWRAHIEQIKINEQNFAKAIPDSRSILENLSADIDKSLEKISKKEAMISKNFTNIVIYF
jgi:translation initiation factor 2 beta subunit (eIF-2beta)/eIF-5